jgi:serine/threonine-protein kinase
MSSDTTLGPYILERELGRGAFGVVYQGHREGRPDSRVAVKTIESRDGNIDRMLVEPALLAKLKHPCIVGLEEYFVQDGKLVLALEFVPGEDLKAYLDRGEQFGPEQVREMLVQLGSALAEAHARQIVHRDLKPSNILVDTSGGRVRYVLTDFGVGRTAEGVQAEKHVGGTYLYMAPEQLRGRPGPQSDLWALGVVAYQMLTGKLPFPGPTLGELSKQIQYTDPPPPSEVTGSPVPADLEAAVRGLLTKSLTERIASAADLLAALGARGDTRRLLSGTTEVGKRTASRAGVPLAKKLERDAGRARATLWACVFLGFLPNGLISSSVFLVGVYLFYRAQGHLPPGRKRSIRTALAVGLMLANQALPPLLGGSDVLTLWVLQWLTAEFARSGVIRPELAMSAVGLGVIVWNLTLMVVGCGAFAELRRLRREQMLLNAALAGNLGSDEFLGLMREMVNCRFEDVGFHLRYAELLYACGDYRRTAVEARLILVQDAYHFNANLLLANSYHALGLYPECVAVCDEYLAVTGYSFEFQELRRQAASRGTTA